MEGWELVVAIVIFVVIIVVVIAIASFIIGGIDQAVNGPPIDPGATDACAECKNYNAWYNGLSTWRQNIEFAYYWLKRTDCTARGCPFSP
jgi:hypothetical protein